MQTYLKTKPVWVQFFLFLGMAIGIFFVVMLIGSVILSKITGWSMTALSDANHWDWNDPAVVTILRGFILLQFLGLFLIPAFLFGYFSDPQPLAYLGLKKPNKNIYWILGITAMMVAIPFVEYTGILNREMIAGNGGNDWAKGMEEQAAKTIQVMLRNRSIGNLAFNLVFVALFAGIGEELFFRGILQRMMIRATKNPWAGILIAAFFFSLFHFQFYGFIPRFLLGIVLGAIYWYSGSLWTAIFAHFIYDAVVIIVAWFNPQMIENPDVSILENTKAMIPVALFSLILTVIIMRFMHTNSTTDYQQIYADDHETPLPKPDANDGIQ